jgi:hypothetical protein
MSSSVKDLLFGRGVSDSDTVFSLRLPVSIVVREHSSETSVRTPLDQKRRDFGALHSDSTKIHFGRVFVKENRSVALRYAQRVLAKIQYEIENEN